MTMLFQIKGQWKLVSTSNTRLNKRITSSNWDTKSLSVSYGFFFLNIELNEGKGKKHLWNTTAIKLTLRKDAFLDAKKNKSSLLPC